MAARIFRIYTTLAILALCGFTVLRGWEVTGFAAARDSLRVGEAAAGRFGAWRDLPGVSGAALRASLAQMSHGVHPVATSDRGDALGALLAVQPSAPGDWLSLAGTRVAIGDPEARFLSALRMSYLTGPNEGGIMVERGLLGLLEWTILPEAVKERTARDLAGAMLDGTISEAGFQVLKSVLAGKSAEMRVELSAQLASQMIPRSLLVGIGL
jgi:hypothetical protein